MFTRIFTVFLAVGLTACQNTPLKLAEFPTSQDFNSTDQSQKALDNAASDLALIREGKDPVSARIKTALYDGGTRTFIGDGYRITDHRRLTSQNGELGMIVGQTVTFDLKATSGRLFEYSDASFKPKSEQDGAANTLPL